MKMKNLFVCVFMSVITVLAWGQDEDKRKNSGIVSLIDSTYNNELVLIQEFRVKAPIEEVWRAYTTAEGWEGWAVAKAQINLKVGGWIKTHYDEKGRIGDSETITLNIINYVPQRLITLQAEITGNFPEFMKKEAVIKNACFKCFLICLNDLFWLFIANK